MDSGGSRVVLRGRPPVRALDLAIHDGAAASASLELLLLHGESLTPPAKHDLRNNLLAYCKRDTLAMVRLYEKLTELAARAHR